MQSRTVIFVTMLGLLAGSAITSAQSLSEFQALPPEDRKAYWDSMSEDERAARREQWRSEREAMSDEELAALREHRRAAHEQRREHWQSMSEEERTAHRDRMRAIKEERRARWDTMSDEEREAHRERMRAMKEERRATWDAMSDEEKAELKKHRGRHGHRPPPGAGDEDSGSP